MQANPQLQISPELQQKYMTKKNQYKQLVKGIVSLEDEKKEHLQANKARCEADRDP